QCTSPGRQFSVLVRYFFWTVTYRCQCAGTTPTTTTPTTTTPTTTAAATT
ncbi:Hypothetical protein FKW44_013094, partial [Caligus rogercresseyi]